MAEKPTKPKRIQVNVKVAPDNAPLVKRFAAMLNSGELKQGQLLRV